MKQDNIFSIFGNSPIVTKNGYRTLSQSAVINYFTSIPNRKIGNYVVKLFRDSKETVLMSDCSPDIYAEIEQKLNELSRSVNIYPHNTTLFSTHDGVYMCSICDEGIIIGYCESKYFDPRKILTYCMFSVGALNGKKDCVFGYLYSTIQEYQRLQFDFQEAKSALLANAFVATSYCSA